MGVNQYDGTEPTIRNNLGLSQDYRIQPANITKKIASTVRFAYQTRSG